MQTLHLEECSDIVSGTLKFENITMDAITLAIDELLPVDGPSYPMKGFCHDVHFRVVESRRNNPETIVAFQYYLDQEKYNSFFYRLTDVLRRRFGNSFVRWDISSSTIITHRASPSAIQLAHAWWDYYTKDLDEREMQRAHVVHRSNLLQRYLEAVSFGREALRLYNLFSKAGESLSQSTVPFQDRLLYIMGRLYGQEIADRAHAMARDISSRAV